MKKLILVIALAASSTSAQTLMMPPFNGAALGTQMTMSRLNNNLMDNLRKKGSSQAREARSSPDAPPTLGMTQSAQLEFTPSMQRRRTNYAGFVERSRSVDPAGADGLVETLSNDPIAMMEPELAKVGLRVDNVADAYTVYWVEAWQAVHGVTGASTRATAQAVREQAAGAIMATPAFASATAAQKQEFAESYLVQALLVGAAKEQAGGDRAKLRQVAAAVEKGARAAGFDLRAMTLTEEGFVPAKRTGAADPAPGAEPWALAATEDAGSRPGYGFLAAAGGAGLGAAFLIGKAMGRKG